MPGRDDTLREKTFKGEYETTEERVFRTLTEGQADRTTRAVAYLIGKLNEKKLLSADDVDDILLGVVTGL